VAGCASRILVTMSTKRVVICDDHDIVRAALRGLIESQVDLEMAGVAVDGADVVPTVRKLKPEVVILDIEMPHSDGVAAIQRLTEAVPGVRILIFSAHERRELIKLVAESGAAGFVGKSESVAAILPAVRILLDGGTNFPDWLTESKADPDELPELDELRRLRSLTAREREILDLFADGLRATAVADRVGIRPATVYTHVRNAIHKLNVDSRTQAVVIATRYDFLSAPPGTEKSD
jgi:DNA-binding NarL/FixJ family response regulator